MIFLLFIIIFFPFLFLVGRICLFPLSVCVCVCFFFPVCFSLQELTASQEQIRRETIELDSFAGRAYTHTLV